MRIDDEWTSGHVPGAQHVFVPDLTANMGRLQSTQPVVVNCGSGYRSRIATSILKRNGFRDVTNVPGSMIAWLDAGYPLETPASA